MYTKKYTTNTIFIQDVTIRPNLRAMMAAVSTRNTNAMLLKTVATIVTKSIVVTFLCIYINNSTIPKNAIHKFALPSIYF